MQKLIDFYEFTNQAFNKDLVSIIKFMAYFDPKQEIISDPLLWEVIRALDKLILINEIKSLKESPTNEITHYKRFHILT